MKCFLAVILLFHVVADFCDSALIGSTIKTFFSIPDTGKQKVCKSGVKTLCHLEVRSNVTPTLSKMCVDGKIKLVKMPEGYTARTDGLRRCTYAGRTFCDGDNILPNYKGWSTRHYCLNGEIRYSVTGRRLKTNQPITGRQPSSGSSSSSGSQSGGGSGNKNVSEKPSFVKPATTKKPKKNPFKPRPQADKQQSAAVDVTSAVGNKEDQSQATTKPPPFSTCK